LALPIAGISSDSALLIVKTASTSSPPVVGATVLVIVVVANASTLPVAGMRHRTSPCVAQRCYFHSSPFHFHVYTNGARTKSQDARFSAHHFLR
jgi:hypothetical protein